MTLGLPPAPYRPGQTPRPSEGQFDALIAAHDAADPAGSPLFKAGFTAFDAGYFWEAHELWEPVWMALPPQSPERHLLQALIQLANAALKSAMGQDRAAARILMRARSARDAAFLSGVDAVLGITPAQVSQLAEQARIAL